MKKNNVFTIVNSLPLKQIQTNHKTNRDKEIRHGTTMRKPPNTRPLKQSPSKQYTKSISLHTTYQTKACMHRCSHYSLRYKTTNQSE